MPPRAAVEGRLSSAVLMIASDRVRQGLAREYATTLPRPAPAPPAALRSPTAREPDSSTGPRQPNVRQTRVR